ncbi:hypothetical protein [Ammoniphilus sp. YIM 78166]|uniref:hypothetical protein n=1 Tax=Ammoniphilus sp. YIM 78166 TaxID=1644106 RepID=UPI00107025E2|nr:hypothetical protein [Ammoniphilus sp. YIM 78166]
MVNWTLFGKSGNPSYEVTKAWLRNHGIPHDDKSVYQMTREEIEKLASQVPGGAKSLVYPDGFSYAMMNPQRAVDRVIVEEIQSGSLSENDILARLQLSPHLMITPILTNGTQVIIGYQYETMVSTFRFVQVRDVYMA